MLRLSLLPFAIAVVLLAIGMVVSLTNFFATYPHELTDPRAEVMPIQPTLALGLEGQSGGWLVLPRLPK